MFSCIKRFFENRRNKVAERDQLCRELLQLRKDAPSSPVPDARTEEYYRQRPCLRMVESATRIYCERLQGALDN